MNDADNRPFVNFSVGGIFKLVYKHANYMFVCFSRWTAKIFKIAVKVFDMNHWSMDFQVEVSDSMFPRRQLTWLSFYILEHSLLVCSTDSSCPGCYCCTWTDSYFNTCSLLLCFFDMSALAIRLWYPWEQGLCFFTLCIFCIWNTTGNMIDIPWRFFDSIYIL